MTLSRMINVVIVEDQPAISKVIQRLVQQQPGAHLLGTCGSVKEAVKEIPRLKPQLLLLDIQLTDGTAFDLLEQLPSLSFKTIFLTAYEQHAIRAIRYRAFDYLLKPINEFKFREAFERVLQYQSITAVEGAAVNKPAINESERLVLSSYNYLQIVNYHDIIYCQSAKGTTTFHLNDGRQIVTSKNLKDYEYVLPAKLFIRTHQSFLVNMRYIDRVHKDYYLILKNKIKIPYSVRKKEEVLQQLKALL